MNEQDEATTLTDAIYDWLEGAVQLLDQREAFPGWEHWFIDKSETYCEDCIKGYQPGTWVAGEHYVYGYPEQEHDGSTRCKACGALVRYTLTSEGVDYELEHFAEGGVFDWDSPTQCYELARIAHGLFEDDEQSLTLCRALKNGLNLPIELAESETTE